MVPDPYDDLNEVVRNIQAYAAKNGEDRMLAFLLYDQIRSGKYTKEKGPRGAAFSRKVVYEILKEITEKNNGAIHDKVGDSVLCVFYLPTDALQTGRAFLTQLHESNLGVQAHLGAHVGQVYVTEERFSECVESVGHAINMSKRIADVTLGGTVVCSDEFARIALSGKPYDETQPEGFRNLGLYEFDEEFEGFEHRYLYAFEEDKTNIPSLASNDSLKNVKRISDSAISPDKLPYEDQKLEILKDTYFTLKRKLGRGAFGEVWCASDQGGKDWALKFCFKDNSEDILKKQLKAQSGPYIQLVEGIIKAYEVYKCEGFTFLKLDYFEGKSLDQWMRDTYTKMDHDEYRRTAREIMCRAARTLNWVHEYNCFHGDIKPQNILVKDSGNDGLQVCLTDFGAGFAADESALSGLRTSRQNIVLSTISYLPGNVRSGVEKIDKGSDVYALGVTLLQLDGRDLGLTPHHDIIASLKERDEVLEEIISAATRTNHEARSSAKDFEAELTRYDKTKKEREKNRRWRWAFWIISTTVPVLILIATLVVWLYFRERNHARTQSELREEAIHNRDVAIHERDKVERMAYDATIYSLAKASEDAVFDIPHERLDALREDLRGWEWGYLRQRKSRLIRTFEGHDGDIKFIDFSPDGALLLSVSSTETATVWDANTGSEVVDINFFDSSTAGAGSNDDRSTGSSSVWAGITYNSQKLVTLSSSGRVAAWDISTGKRETRFPMPDGKVSKVRLNKVLPYMAVYGTEFDDRLTLINTDTGAIGTTPALGDRPMNQLEFSPNGRYLAFASPWAEGVFDVIEEKDRYSQTLTPGPYRSLLAFPGLGDICIMKGDLYDMEAQLTAVFCSDAADIAATLPMDLSSTVKDGLSFLASDPEDKSTNPCYLVGNRSSVHAFRFLEAAVAAVRSKNYDTWVSGTYISGNDRIALLSASGDISLWSPEKGGILERLPGTSAHSIIARPQNPQLASKSTNTISLWDVDYERAPFQYLPISAADILSANKFFVLSKNHGNYEILPVTTDLPIPPAQITKCLSVFERIVAFNYSQDRVQVIGCVANEKEVMEQLETEYTHVGYASSPFKLFHSDTEKTKDKGALPETDIADNLTLIDDVGVSPTSSPCVGMLQLPLSGVEIDHDSTVSWISLGEVASGYVHGAAAFSSDGCSVAAGSSDGAVLISDLNLKMGNKHPLTFTKVLAGEVVTSLAFNPSGTVCALGKGSGKIALTTIKHNFKHVRTDNSVKELDFPNEVVGVPQSLVDLKFSPDGTYLVGLRGRTLCFVSVDKEGRFLSNQFNIIKTDGPATCATFSPDSKRVAVCLRDKGNVSLFNTESRNELLALECASPDECFFTPDGLGLVTISREANHVLLWRVTPWKDNM